jgi:hypothetical protein
VVEEVVSARKTITWDRPFTVAEVAKVWARSVTVHTVCLPLMTEEACSGRELNADAHFLIAAERLQVRVNILADATVSQRCVERHRITYS